MAISNNPQLTAFIGRPIYILSLKYENYYKHIVIYDTFKSNIKYTLR